MHFLENMELFISAKMLLTLIFVFFQDVKFTVKTGKFPVTTKTLQTIGTVRRITSLLT